VPNLDINVIRVGIEGFTSQDLGTIDYAIEKVRSIYKQVGLYLNNANRFDITVQQAGPYVTIDSSAEATDLTTDWTVPNGALDVFVVRAMNGAVGWSPVSGSCDKNATGGMTGSVVSLEGDRDFIANTFAHEIGHYLGLPHNSHEGNLMGDPDGNSNSSTEIYAWQGDTMKHHCFIYG
jgi:Metallo-peptidase family M12B Reprolysin-like